MPIFQAAHLVEVISAIQEAEDRTALTGSFLNALKPFGFDGFSISINAKDRHDLLSPQLTSLADTFFKDYIIYRFDDVCPVLANAISVNAVFSWSSARSTTDKHEQKLLNYLRAIPILRGLVIPLPHIPNRVSSANITSSREVSFDERTVHCVAILARVAMMRAESLGLCAEGAQTKLLDADLSAIQIGILNWAAQGKTNPDIAIIMGLSRRAVEYHMSAILRKLRVATRAQAIALLVGKRNPPAS